ncbi:hypothetical protein CTAM01_02019, partial [Colletotrichum tamarilloi]
CFARQSRLAAPERCNHRAKRSYRSSVSTSYHVGSRIHSECYQLCPLLSQWPDSPRRWEWCATPRQTAIYVLSVLCAAIGRPGPEAPRSPRSPEHASRGAMQLRAVTSSAPAPTCDRCHAVEAIPGPIWTFCRPK